MDNPVTFKRATGQKILDHVFGPQTTVDAPPDTTGRDINSQRFRPLNTFRNTTSETVPGFALLKVKEDGVGIDGNRFWLEIEKPDGDASACYVINGPRPVEAGNSGQYQDAADHFILLTDATEGTVGPGNDWPAVEEGSIFKVVGQVRTDAPNLALVTRLTGTSLQFAQAPVGGFPARSDSALTEPVECRVVVVAPEDSNFAGTLVFNTQIIELQNWAREPVATSGDRLVQHDGSIVVGYDCSGAGNGNFNTIEARFR